MTVISGNKYSFPALTLFSRTLSAIEHCFFFANVSTLAWRYRAVRPDLTAASVSGCQESLKFDKLVICHACSIDTNTYFQILFVSPAFLSDLVYLSESLVALIFCIHDIATPPAWNFFIAVTEKQTIATSGNCYMVIS
jgi:hypothetical protein